jgi:hypothetical protein
LIFGGIISIDLLYFPFLEEQGILLIIELLLSYSAISFHVFLFIKGISYYKSKNHRQNYYLIAIIVSGTILFLLFLAGSTILAFYVLNSRFPAYMIFFNMLIIQNTYFNDFIKKKQKYLFLLIFIFLLIASFLSLRKLGYG